MKRQIILFITLSLLLSIASFIGCGGGGTTTVSPIQPVSTNTPSSPDVPTQIPTEIQSTPTPIVTFTPSSATIELQQQIDAAGGGWTAGNNPVAALSDEDKVLLCGCILSNSTDRLQAYNLSGQQLPSSFSRKDYLTSIKDQGVMGTCTAFAAVACVESCVMIALHDSSKYIDLSEAHLFKYGGGNVIKGGMSLENAANYFKNTGVPPEEYFPYNPATMASGSSKSGWQNYVTKITSLQYFNIPSDVQSTKDFIYNYGPVLAGFIVYDDFYNYRSGVYKYVSGPKLGGHAVCIYGWDDVQGCWLAKNSWGYSWGDNGCFKIAYGQCRIDDGYYPKIGMKYIVSSNTPTPVITATTTPLPGSTSTPTPTFTPTKTPTPGTITIYSSTTANHAHNITISASDLNSPPSSGKTYTSTVVDGHTHSVFISQTQLTQINNGNTVTVTSSEANGHNHTWTIMKSYTVTSGIADSHVHNLVVSMVDVSNSPSSGVTYTSSTTNGHTHTVALTQAQLNSINTGNTVNVNSSYSNNHTHNWSIISPNPAPTPTPPINVTVQ